MQDITPLYEFGYGLSYTTYNYSNLVITPLDAPPYIPANGTTIPAPTIVAHPIDVSNVNTSDYLFPDDILQYPTFIYLYLNSTNLSLASRDREYGRSTHEWLPPNATSSAPLLIHPAGGAPGGNPLPWVPVCNVSATIANTGARAGHEVVQLYVNLGKDSPPRVLRGFEKVFLQPGEEKTVTMQLLRRDISVWSTEMQDWVPAGEGRRVVVWVGSSSKDLRLQEEIVF